MSQLDINDNQSSSTGSWGVRADLDLYRRGRLTIGVGLALLRSTLSIERYDGAWGTVETDDVRAQVAAAYTVRAGKWSLRFAGALGLAYTSGSGLFDSMSVEAHGALATSEASAVVARDLTSQWGVAAGPVLSIFPQEYVFASGGQATTLERGAELGFYGAIVRRL